MSKLRQKLSSAFGIFGSILYFVISLAIVSLPMVVFWDSVVLSFLYFFGYWIFPPISGIFWVWGLFRVISGQQGTFSLIYYIAFVVMFLPFFVAFLRSLFSNN